MVVNIKIMVFCNMMPYSLVDSNHSFRRMYCLHFQDVFAKYLWFSHFLCSWHNIPCQAKNVLYLIFKLVTLLERQRLGHIMCGG
jgi:hypothetical protein